MVLDISVEKVLIVPRRNLEKKLTSVLPDITALKVINILSYPVIGWSYFNLVNYTNNLKVSYAKIQINSYLKEKHRYKLISYKI